jgi:hypothetical protein
MEVRTLAFVDEPDAKPRLYSCGVCGRATSPRTHGGGEIGHEKAKRIAEACCAPPPVLHCPCSKVIEGGSESTCFACQRAASDAAIIAAATVIDEPPDILCIVGTDEYFQDVDDAAERFPGAWAHPCDRVMLHVNPKRLADELVESAVERMCDDAFEDAEDHVEGTTALGEAIEAALVMFNDAQTSACWHPDLSKVFKLPGGPVAA